MARVFLHIGGHKTGTSFLQSMFHRNRALLARDAIHYPDIGPNNAHHALVRPWIVTPDIPDRFFGRAGADGVWERLTDTYAAMAGTLFLSAENFSRVRPTRVDMADLARRLAPFEEVRGLVARRVLERRRDALVADFFERESERRGVEILLPKFAGAWPPRGSVVGSGPKREE